MVTSVTPIIEQQHMARAQARAGGQDAHVRFDFVAYLDSSTSTISFAKQTPDQSYVVARNRAGEYCCNQQYSVTAITTSTGAIAERYAYSAYGQPTILNASGSILSSSTISNRYTHTGREWDATLGLHHFRARWMSPIAGRFLSRDQIGYEDGLILTASYFMLSKSDPSGNGCRICTTLESVDEVKNERGEVIGCVLAYVIDPNREPKSYNGSVCKPNCEQVLTCQDMPDLSDAKIHKLKDPKTKGFWKKNYCPPKDEWEDDQTYCFGVTGKRCKSDFANDFKSCKDLCDSSDYVRYLCESIRVVGLKQICQQFVSGSKANCMYYCESRTIEIDNKK